ncbi:small integral membrane protein 8-like [Asterias amurensis]|uniref:small integral membrane protein 8-like n=1 Tax=Asterias amurensis TaxID=7602 RepID=UPI003AB2FB71
MAESTDSNQKPSTGSGQKSSRPQGGLGTVRTTSLFRAVNFELFARQNKYVMGFGLVALTGCVAYIAYLNATTENKRDKMYEEHHSDGTKEMRIKRSKWD